MNRPRLAVRRASAQRLAIATALLAALAAPRAAHAQIGLFPERAELDVPVTSGLVRVELPADVIARCGPALGDLRVFDANGTSHPYVIDGAPPSSERVTSSAITPAEARQVTETPADARPRYREEYDLDLPAVAPPGGSWTLVLATDDPHFTSEVRVERAGDGGEVELVTARTVFRLPSGSERLDVALPAGLEGRLHVRISGEQGFLSPTFAVRSAVPPADPTFVSLPLAVESTEQLAKKTVIVVRRPQGFVPTWIAIDTSATTAERYVRVVDAGAGGSQEVVGEARVSRVADRTALLLVPIDGAKGDLLRVEIDDGDAGPLPDLGIEARIHQPSVVFDAGTTTPPAYLYFGGARALPPSFPEAATLLRASREGAPPAVARIRRVEPNPSYSREPALAFAMHPGDALEVEAYAHEAEVVVPESPEGLVRIVVPRAVESRVDPNRRDLRFVDAQGRQWPYLEGNEAFREEVPLESQRTAPRPRTSRYTLTFDDGPVAVQTVVLRVTAEYVDRRYALFGPPLDERGDERLLASGRLRRGPGESAELRIDLGARVDRLFLEVEDGDDAPLSFRATATVALPVIFVAAPPGTYRLLFGVPDAVSEVQPPSYELESARAQVFSVPAVDARVGPVRPNPRFSPPSPYSSSRMRDLALWAVLGLAVVVLGVLTFRLAKLAPPPDAPPGGPVPPDTGAPEPPRADPAAPPGSPEPPASES